jgi:hypothetical protein
VRAYGAIGAAVIVALGVLLLVHIVSGASVLVPDGVPGVGDGHGRIASTPSGGMPTILDEHFGGSRSSWPHDPAGVAWFIGGGHSAPGYQLFARDPGRFVAIGAPIVASFRDVVVTAQFRKVGGPPGGGYGIIVRNSGSTPLDGRNQRGRYYVFEAGDRGEFGVWRREEERWIDLVPWTVSPAMRPGYAENELMVRAIGDHLSFLINGVDVADLRDGSLNEGGAGIFVGGDANQAVVNRFVVEAPALHIR